MLTKTFILTTLALISFSASAEKVSIPSVHQHEISKPSTGITKSNVEAKFGAPINRHGPVGEPAISSWEYPSYTVYFEHDHVIHSVVKGQYRKKSGS